MLKKSNEFFSFNFYPHGIKFTLGNVLKTSSLLQLQLSMNVSSEMAAVIKTVLITMELKDVVVREDTDWDMIEKHAEVCR